MGTAVPRPPRPCYNPCAHSMWPQPGGFGAEPCRARLLRAGDSARARPVKRRPPAAENGASMTACIILAGGRSRRLGADKRRLRLWGPAGPTLLEHTVALARQVVPEVLVVLNDPAAWPDLPARLVPDAFPGAGPLGGLASGLRAMAAGDALLLACDLPLLQPALLAALRDAPLEADALVPLRPEGRAGPRNARAAEPLLARYCRACLPAAESCLACGERRMIALLEGLRVAWLPPEAWRRHDPDGVSFLNINRPEDLAAVLRRLAGGP